MSTDKKLRAASDGKPPSEVTKFKELWRTKLSDEEKSFVLDLLQSSVSQPAALAQINARHHLNLTRNEQHTILKAWCEEQKERDDEEERAREDERQLEAEHPDWTKEQIREDVIKRTYRRVRAKGDFYLGLKTVTADAKLEAIGLDRDKFEFDATEACLKKLDTLKAIKADSTLTEEQKLQKARLELFGVTPN